MSLMIARIARTTLVLAALSTACLVPQGYAQPAPAGADPTINERFYNPGPEWQARFEGESREIYARRNEIVAASGARAGMTVADVGAGSGFMAMLFAKQVGPAGRVIAADVSKPFTVAIALRAKNSGITNVTTVVGTQTETGLPPDVADIMSVIQRRALS
jgi:predicted methyltransferase